MYDTIIIGARCAGAATALLLSQQGHKVLLVDRAAVGSDIPHGHFVHRGGTAKLQAWGVLDKLDCPLVTTVVMGMGEGEPLTGTDLYFGDVPFGVGPRRRVLDKLLVETAVAAGVELRDQVVVEDFRCDGDQIRGIQARDLRSGQRFREQAPMTIGVDGRHSRLARTVDAPMFETVPPLLCYYFSYWSGIDYGALEVHSKNQRVIFAFPTNDNLFAIFVAWPVAMFQQVRSDIESHYMAVLDRAPALAERARAGKREEPFYGTADLPNYFRKPYGPGWALVGDAGHHKDPYMALGVADAFRDAELVAEAVHEGLTGCQPFDAALANYETQRNELAMPLYRENIARASFAPPPPEVAQIRNALLANQDQADTNAFLSAALGLTPPESFFNPANVGRIMQKAAVVTA